MTIPERTFCLIRHGQTDANRDGIIAGRIEAQLTEEGRAAARALADHVWHRPIMVFTSPQDRARETAHLAFPTHHVTIVQGLHERDWGEFEGRLIGTLPPRTSTPDGGEGWDDMLERINAALSCCIVQSQNALPVIVAHSGVIRAVRALIGHDFTGPSAPNTTPLLYSFVGGEWHERPLFAARTDI